MLRIAFLSVLLLGQAAALAEELVLPQTWPSPDKRFTIRHGASDDLRSGLNGERLALTAYSLFSPKVGVLWSGTSWVDSSSHSFRCVWASDSNSAVILDRPQRASVEACLIRTTASANGTILRIQQMIDQILAEAGDTDNRDLQKAWFGEWRFENGRFHGTVIVARARYYRLRCTMNPAEPKPVLQLLEKSTSEEWNDAFEKL